MQIPDIVVYEFWIENNILTTHHSKNSPYTVHLLSASKVAFPLQGKYFITKCVPAFHCAVRTKLLD